METWIYWLITIACLLTLEILFQSAWAFCLAVGCTGGVITYFAGGSLPWQIGVTALSSIIVYVIMIPYFQRYFAKVTEKRGKSVRTGMDALLGRKGILSQQITKDSFGRMKIDGDSWQVKSCGQIKEIPKGTEVVVVGYDSIVLAVEPYDI